MSEKVLLNKLIDIKLLLEHGLLHMNEKGRIDRMLAIHHAHQAVELSLKIMAEQMGSNAYDYPTLVKFLKNQKKGRDRIEMPFERSLDQLNKTRVLAQHYGEPPEHETVIKLVSIAKEAIIDFWKKEFCIDYDEVSLFGLLQDNDLITTLRKAEVFLKEKNYEKSIEQSVLAIHKNIWKLGKKFPPPAFQSKGGLLDELMGYGSNTFEKWDDFLYVILSLPYASKLKALKQKTGIVFLFSEDSMQKMKNYAATPEDADSAFSLASEYSLWIQQMYF